MASINTFDRSLKVIVRNHAELFLRLLRPDLPLALVKQPENVELSLPVQPVDFVHRMLYEEEEQLLHIEFQLEHFADFPRRMCHLHGALTQQYRLPVHSFAIYLNYRKAPIPNEYIAQLGDVVTNRFTYPIIKLWEYVAQIRNGHLRELAPLLVMLEENPDAETLQIERELILTEPDPEKRADLLALAVTIAARSFDQEFLRRFFREELTQMEHATLIDEWLEEAVQEAVQEAEKKADIAVKLAAQKARNEGIHERAIDSILRILSVRFGLSEMQKEGLQRRLNQITTLAQLDELEIQALQSFNFTTFQFIVDELLSESKTNGTTK